MSALDLFHPRLTRVGILEYDPAVERYEVEPGSTAVIALTAGDRLLLADRQGAQRCDFVVLDARWRDALAALDLEAAGRGLAPGSVTGRQAARGRFLEALARAAFDPAELRPAHLFGTASPPGAAWSTEADRDLVVLVSVPDARMAMIGGLPATPISVAVIRGTPAQSLEALLPAPLAEPRLELLVDRAAALAYEVRAGEYIQIIDVRGRQCSDFLAFRSRDLEGGVERGIDATATRTFMGTAYPLPGQHAKFLDQDLRPLIEVVQDTVGRHDTFGLACTARYYEDMGYPGHANCSDNFNAVLADFGLSARRGWPAVNYFFNTSVGACGAIDFDEAWSKPGDYVLLRAPTDLVCASSACPDDISPANGWDPTEIFIRVYSPQKLFASALGYRTPAGNMTRLTKQTPFHPRTAGLTGHFAEYRGYWLPTQFTDHGPQQEYLACRERVTVMDLSALRKVEVLGPDAEALLQYCLTRDVSRLATGQVSYAAMCGETGGLIDDGTLFRLGLNNFRWIGGDDRGGVWLRECALTRGLKVLVKDSTDSLCNLAVQGPNSRALLAELVWTPASQPALDALKWFRFTVGRLGGEQGPPLVVSRTGYTGELGYELWCHPEDALELWDALWRAGAAHGLAPLGLHGLDMLRIEAGLVFAGQDFDDEVDPFEAGIGFVVETKAKGEQEFVGKAALARRGAAPSRRLVGLELAGREPARHGDPVFQGASRVGTVTSATRSPLLAKNIALARLAVECAAPGTGVEIGKLDSRQKRLTATVVPTPFYDPQKLRVRQ